MNTHLSDETETLSGKTKMNTFEPHVPNVARIYGRLLNGKDHFGPDRDAASNVLKAFPGAADLAKANRRFLGRTVLYLARRGYDQFLNIGAGLPVDGWPNVHKIVSESHPDTFRVACVDNDPVVVTHCQAESSTPNCRTFEGDLRDPSRIMSGIPGLHGVLDFTRPIVVLLVAVLPFLRDTDAPLGVVRTLRDALPPDSAIVISHVTDTGADPAIVRGVTDAYAHNTVVFRTQEQILRLFIDLDMVNPAALTGAAPVRAVKGVVDVQDWRPDSVRHEGLQDVRVLGGVGIKRGTP